MSAQEHDYELGTLDHEVLERDESIARHQRQRGDERRWMILGAAGTLALLTALVGAVALGGNSEPRHLAASLGSPARDLAAVAAQAVVNQAQSETEPAPTAAKGTRFARKADAPATETKKDLGQPTPATSKPDPAAAIPASTSSAAAAPVAKPPVDEPKAGESDDNAFAGLPTVDAADEPAPEAAPPSDFAHDDNPFVDEEDEQDEGDDEDDGEDLAAAPV